MNEPTTTEREKDTGCCGAARSAAYRYEALCKVCWKQFELPCEDSEHVCSSPHCQRVKLMKRCDYCETRTHHETNGSGMWICTVCACDDTPLPPHENDYENNHSKTEAM